MNLLPLPIAVRAYAIPKVSGRKTTTRKSGQHKPIIRPDFLLVFAVHPSRDYSQKLLWGAYRVFEGEEPIEEGFFYADDLRKKEIEQLKEYCSSNHLRCLSRKEFLKKVFYAVAFQVRGSIVGFDLPFGLSRIAEEWTRARKPYEGGFNFKMLTYTDSLGQRLPDSFTPRVSIKSLDSYRAMIGFTSVRNEVRAKLPQFREFRCEFVDVRTLAFALSGERYSLEEASKAFGAAEGEKQEGSNDYARLRNRVTRIGKLYFSLVREFEKHPIQLKLGRAFSPASIGKAYFRQMGIGVPQLVVDPEISVTKNDVYGWAMASYFGGRTETRVTKVEVPVVYCDFISMYPTVNALIGTWDFLRAKEIKIEDATNQTRELVKSITAAALFETAAWKELAVLVQVLPAGDILPMRARFSNSPGSTFITALNPIYTETPLWFTLADVIASTLLSGKPPEILRAIRFTPQGIQSNLSKISLRGTIDFDPVKDDFFKTIVEEKHRLGDGVEAQRIKRFLKTMNNSAGYGIFVELNRQEEKQSEVEVFGLEHFQTDVDHPELPGKFFFPPLAAFIPAAARLMLALAELELLAVNGSYAFMDTDSMAIISTPLGGLIPMPSGKEKLKDGTQAMRAISWWELEKVRRKFTLLSPYNPAIIPGSILRLENENLRLDSIPLRRPSTTLLLHRIVETIRSFQ